MHEAFKQEEKDLVLGLMQRESFDVNQQVARLLCLWLLDTGTFLYETMTDEYDRSVLGCHLATMCSHMGLYDRAEVLFRRVLSFSRKTYGNERSENVESSPKHGDLAEEGRQGWMRLNPFTRRYRSGLVALLGSKHPTTLKAICKYDNLGQGNLEEAATFFKGGVGGTA